MCQAGWGGPWGADVPVQEAATPRPPPGGKHQVAAGPAFLPCKLQWSLPPRGLEVAFPAWNLVRTLLAATPLRQAPTKAP